MFYSNFNESARPVPVSRNELCFIQQIVPRMPSLSDLSLCLPLGQLAVVLPTLLQAVKLHDFSLGIIGVEEDTTTYVSAVVDALNWTLAIPNVEVLVYIYAPTSVNARK